MQLKTSAILNVPFQCYEENFVFIVNEKEYQTKRIIADLLSSKICHLHSIDPTIDHYSIKTDEKGDFMHILKLINFKVNEVPESEIPFLIEVCTKFESEFIEIIENEETTEITLNNIFDKIQKHEPYKKYYSKSFHDEIEFISSHFHEFGEQEIEKLMNLKLRTLIEIFSNEQLKLEDEDQLFEMINKLYLKDSSYSILYETVNFLNVSTSSISEFASQFDMNDLTNGIWNRICERLRQAFIKTNDKKCDKKQNGTTFNYMEGQPFSGIINHLKTKSNGNIENEISFSASSYFSSLDKYNIKNITLFDNQNNGFATKSSENSWLCIDFKEHRIIPTDYTIKIIDSYFGGTSYGIKSWVIETSNDNQTWDVIDEVNQDSHLRGNLSVHTFKIQKQQNKEARFIRIRMTDKDWLDSNYLAINSFEVFGTLI